MVIHFMIVGSLSLMVTTKPLIEKAMILDENIDTCNGCSSDEIAKYVFDNIKKSLEIR